MGDAKDILGLPRAQHPPPRSESAAEKKERKGPVLTGLNRELYNLTGGIPPVVASLANPALGSSSGKKVSWKWQRIESSAWPTPLPVSHWEKHVAGQKHASDYPYAKYNKPPVILEYTDEEYNQLLTNADWSREETDHLMDLCRRFGLRFIVIADRYSEPAYKIPKKNPAPKAEAEAPQDQSSSKDALAAPPLTEAGVPAPEKPTVPGAASEAAQPSDRPVDAAAAAASDSAAAPTGPPAAGGAESTADGAPASAPDRGGQGAAEQTAGAQEPQLIQASGPDGSSASISNLGATGAAAAPTELAPAGEATLQVAQDQGREDGGRGKEWPSRSVEELKQRYFDVVQKLASHRCPPTTFTPVGGAAAPKLPAQLPVGLVLPRDRVFNMAQERERKKALAYVLSRTRHQVEEEELILKRAKEIMEARGIPLTGERPAGTGGGGSQEKRKRGAVGGPTRRPPAAPAPAATAAQGDVGSEIPSDVQAALGQLAGPSSKVPKVYVRGLRLAAALQAANNTAGARLTRRIEQTLEELGVPLKPRVSTRAVCTEYVALRKEVVALLNLQKKVHWKAHELALLKDGQTSSMAAQAAAAGALAADGPEPGAITEAGAAAGASGAGGL